MLINPNFDPNDSRSKLLSLNKAQYEKFHDWVAKDESVLSSDDLVQSTRYVLYDIGLNFIYRGHIDKEGLEAWIFNLEWSQNDDSIFYFNLAMDAGYTSGVKMDYIDFVVDHIWSNLH